REGSGAEGDIGLARPAAAMAEEGGLLIDEAGADGELASTAEIAGRRADLRQDLRGNPEEAAELRIPLPGREAHQAGARGRGDVGRIDPGEVVEEEAVAGAEPEPAAGEQALRLGQLIENPSELAGREIGIKGKAGAGDGELLRTLGLQLLGHGQRAGILPDDG